MEFRLSRHAREELKRRNIPLALLNRVLQQPQQIVPQDERKRVYQSQVDFGADNIFLLRAVVDDRTDPATVVTVYRTKKIDKYWRKS